MMKRLAIVVGLVLLAVGIAAGAIVMNTSAQDGQKSEKPILLMTPADLFSNPQLRALAVAAQHGDVKRIDNLIAQGVDVNGSGRYGIAPLFSAWQARNKEGFEALLKHGANPNNIWTTGHTLLNLIAGSSDPDLLKLALKYGADPDLVAPRLDETPIFAAVEYRNGNVNVPILIKAGANLNYQKKPSMKTAIMDAAELGQFDLVYELLEAGADYKLKDTRGRDLRDSIRFSYRITMKPIQHHWRDRVIEFLKQHGFW